jgi:hypothetical protein
MPGSSPNFPEGISPQLMKRRVEITVEKHRRLVLRSGREGSLSWCRLCDEGVLMLRPEEAAVKAGVSEREINRWVEAETVHFDETPDGRLFICANSIPRI